MRSTLLAGSRTLDSPVYQFLPELVPAPNEGEFNRPSDTRSCECWDIGVNLSSLCHHRFTSLPPLTLTPSWIFFPFLHERAPEGPSVPGAWVVVCRPVQNLAGGLIKNTCREFETYRAPGRLPGLVGLTPTGRQTPASGFQGTSLPSVVAAGRLKPCKRSGGEHEQEGSVDHAAATSLPSW